MSIFLHCIRIGNEYQYFTRYCIKVRNSIIVTTLVTTTEPSLWQLSKLKGDCKMQMKALEKKWTLSDDLFVKLLFPRCKMNFDAHLQTPFLYLPRLSLCVFFVGLLLALCCGCDLWWPTVCPWSIQQMTLGHLQSVPVMTKTWRSVKLAMQVG